MKLNLYLQNNSFLPPTDKILDIQQHIEEMAKVFDHCDEAGDAIFQSEDFYNADGRTEFMEWLFTPEAGLDEHKRILQILFEKAQLVGKAQYDEVEERITNNDLSAPNAMLCLYSDQSSDWYITTQLRWSLVHRYYLKWVDTEEDFIKYSQLCFFNLLFHKEVVKTMRTLNYPFERYKEEIITHLEAINDNFPDIFEAHHNTGYVNVSRVFSTSTSIDCTPESRRDTARRRTFVFTDSQNNPIPITCELHTKFRSMGVNRDRLYFHPGHTHIARGKKVLIAHIGDHLD